MDNLLFFMALKPGRLAQYQEFIKEISENKTEEWQDLLARYDLLNATIWLKNIDGTDYVMVYHNTGPDFEEKFKAWDTSSHPFDQWFKKQITDNCEPMEVLTKLGSVTV